MEPTLISSKLVAGGERLFAAGFHGPHQPSDKDVVRAQEQFGYDPRGYGGPWAISRLLQADGSWLVTWRCGASSD